MTKQELENNMTKVAGIPVCWRTQKANGKMDVISVTNHDTSVKKTP